MNYISRGKTEGVAANTVKVGVAEGVGGAFLTHDAVKKATEAKKAHAAKRYHNWKTNTSKYANIRPRIVKTQPLQSTQ